MIDFDYMAEAVNDSGEHVPDTCPSCGSPVKIFLKGEPVYLCTNKRSS